MKHFEQSRTRLAGLPFHARLVYSIFVGFTLLGLAGSLWLAYDMVGFRSQGVVHYYGGGQELPSLDPNDFATSKLGPPSNKESGPIIELPDDVDAFQTAPAISLRKLLEVSHFHLFSLPVVLLILSHLYMLCSASPKTKTFWIATSSLACAIHIAAPWIAAISPSQISAGVYGISGLLMIGGMTVMAWIPLLDMWLSRKPPHSPKS